MVRVLKESLLVSTNLAAQKRIAVAICNSTDHTVNLVPFCRASGWVVVCRIILTSGLAASLHAMRDFTSHIRRSLASEALDAIAPFQPLEAGQPRPTLTNTSLMSSTLNVYSGDRGWKHALRVGTF